MAKNRVWELLPEEIWESYIFFGRVLEFRVFTVTRY